MDSEQQLKTHAKPNHKGLLWFSLASVLLIIIVSGAILLLSYSADPIPANVRDGVPFSVYYPAKVPSGVTLKASTIRASGSTVFFELANAATGKPIQVSQQPIPKNFDPQVMFEHSNVPTTISPLGSVYDLSYKTQSRFMVVTPNSLIFVTSTPKISDAQLQSVVNGLKVSR